MHRNDPFDSRDWKRLTSLPAGGPAKIHPSSRPSLSLSLSRSPSTGLSSPLGNAASLSLFYSSPPPLSLSLPLTHRVASSLSGARTHEGDLGLQLSLSADLPSARADTCPAQHPILLKMSLKRTIFRRSLFYPAVRGRTAGSATFVEELGQRVGGDASQRERHVEK